VVDASGVAALLARQMAWVAGTYANIHDGGVVAVEGDEGMGRGGTRPKFPCWS